MDKSAANKDFFSHLESEGYLSYGALIPQEVVLHFLGIIPPETGTAKEFDQLRLKEVNAIGYVRGQLLNEGKYLGSNKEGYRIFLPSENLKQCERYQLEARRKIGRSVKLSSNTPQEYKNSTDQSSDKAMMLLEGMKPRS